MYGHTYIGVWPQLAIRGESWRKRRAPISRGKPWNVCMAIHTSGSGRSWPQAIGLGEASAAILVWLLLEIRGESWRKRRAPLSRGKPWNVCMAMHTSGCGRSWRFAGGHGGSGGHRYRVESHRTYVWPYIHRGVAAVGDSRGGMEEAEGAVIVWKATERMYGHTYVSSWKHGSSGGVHPRSSARLSPSPK